MLEKMSSLLLNFNVLVLALVAKQTPELFDYNLPMTMSCVDNIIQNLKTTWQNTADRVL